MGFSIEVLDSSWLQLFFLELNQNNSSKETKVETERIYGPFLFE